MTAFLDEVDPRYGGILEFLAGLGVTPTALGSVRKRMIVA